MGCHYARSIVFTQALLVSIFVLYFYDPPKQKPDVTTDVKRFL